jgi:hypothetical protein
MKRLKPIVGILIIFFLGASAGVLSARFYGAFESRRPHHRPKMEERVEFIMKRLTDDLGLSTTQQEEIRQIVVSTEEKIQPIRDAYESNTRALHDKGIQEMRTRLTHDQRAKLDQIHAEWKRRRQDRKSR